MMDSRATLGWTLQQEPKDKVKTQAFQVQINQTNLPSVATAKIDSTKIEFAGPEADSIESLAEHFLADSVVSDEELTSFGQHIKLLDSAEPFTLGLNSTRDRAPEVVKLLLERVDEQRLNVGHEAELLSMLQSCKETESTGFLARDLKFDSAVSANSATNDWFIGVCSAERVTLVYFKTVVPFEYYDKTSGPSTVGLDAFLNKLLKEQFLRTVSGKCPVSEV